MALAPRRKKFHCAPPSSRRHFSFRPPPNGFAGSSPWCATTAKSKTFACKVRVPVIASPASPKARPPSDSSCPAGEGQLIALELLSVSGEERPLVLGEAHDVTADHFVRFEPCNPHTAQRKTVVIRSNVYVAERAGGDARRGRRPTDGRDSRVLPEGTWSCPSAGGS